MQIALYIALGLLVATAIGMQVWLLRSGVRAGSGGGAAFFRVLNIVLIVGVVALVIYVLAGR